MNWTYLSLLNWSTEYFQKNNIQSARLDSEILLSYLLKISRIQLYIQFEKPMTDVELADYKKLIKRRIAGEPIAYITGVQEFWSLDFKVGEGVLIPRPDTEVLVEKVLEAFSKSKIKENKEIQILDIATGSGILAIVLAKEISNSKITAVDISAIALNYAEDNAKKHQVENQITFIEKDFFEISLKQQFDIIVCNPPYVDHKLLPQLNVSQFEPHLALNGGQDGLAFYKRMAQVIPFLLKPDSFLFMEIGFDQASSVCELFGFFNEVEVFKDYSGKDRVIQCKK